jgi:hypothetical protein
VCSPLFWRWPRFFASVCSCLDAKNDLQHNYSEDKRQNLRLFVHCVRSRERLSIQCVFCLVVCVNYAREMRHKKSHASISYSGDTVCAPFKNRNSRKIKIYYETAGNKVVLSKKLMILSAPQFITMGDTYLQTLIAKYRLTHTMCLLHFHAATLKSFVLEYFLLK